MTTLTNHLLGAYIDVAQYPKLSEAIPDKKLEIVELIEPDEIALVTARYQPFLEGIEAAPLAVTLGDEMLFIGTSGDNSGFIYYVDIEFGVFLLEQSLQDFVSALEL